MLRSIYSYCLNTEIILAFITTTFILVLFYCRNKKSIPGPIGLPIVGYLPFITDELHIDLAKLAQKYGPIFKIKLGSIEAVVLNDYQSIVDALVKSDFSARPLDSIFNAIDDNISMTLMHGEQWKEQRKFVTKKMHDFGVGKREIEQIILNEINSFHAQLDEQKGTPHNLFTLITGFTLNIILQFLTGQRMENKSEYFINILKILSGENIKHQEEPKFATLGSYFPTFIRFVIKLKLINVPMINALRTLKDFGEQLVTQKESVPEESHEDMGYIDDFFKKIQCSSENTFTRQVLINNVTGFFPAGVQTLADALAMTLVAVCHFTKYQEIMRKEINDNLGPDHVPTFNDRKRLTFTHAFLLETQRWISYIPLNLPRRALETVKFKDFTIKKDTQIWANIWNAHRDSKIWENVDQFNPERFLSDDRTYVINENKLLTYSRSKRTCPGEALANTCLFLFIVSLLQKYSIQTRDGRKASFGYHLAVSKRPKNMDFKFIRQ